MARAVIRHVDFTSRDDLIDKTDTCVIEKNAVAKPCRWTCGGAPLKAASRTSSHPAKITKDAG